MSQYTDYFNNNITHEYALMLDEDSPQGLAQPTRTSNSTYTSSANWTYTQSGTHIQTVNDGFLTGQKCWRVRLSNISGTFARYRSSVTSHLNLYSDDSWSAGVWFNAESIGSGTVAVPFYGVRPATRGFLISLYYDTNTNKNTLFIPIGDKTKSYTSDNYPTLTTNTWNYVAIRRDGANVYIYLNGQLIDTDTSVAINTTASMVGVDIGNTTNLYTSDIKIASPYVAGFNSITGTEIQNIWNARSSLGYVSTPMTASALINDPIIKIDNNITQTSMTADALIMHPTIVTTIGDNTYVTTSFEASAIFPSDISVTEYKGSNYVSEPLTATALLVYPFNIETTLDRNVSAEPATASALMNNARASETAFIASALLPMPTLNIDENYYQKVMKHNPLIYVEDGQLTPTNHGSWPINEVLFSANISPSYINGVLVDGWDDNVFATQELQTIGNQKAWRTNTINPSPPEYPGQPPQVISTAYPTMRFKTSDNDRGATRVNNLYATRALSIEFWFKPPQWLADDRFYPEVGNLFNDGITQIGEGFDFGYNEQYFRRGICEGIFDERKPVLYGHQVFFGDSTNQANASFGDYIKYDSNIIYGSWNHLVITYEPGAQSYEIRQKLYLNGEIIGNQVFDNRWIDQTPTNPTVSTYYNQIRNSVSVPQNVQLWDSFFLGGRETFFGMPTGFNSTDIVNDCYFDEFAYYGKTLTYSDIIEHYNFIRSKDPNVYFGSTWSFPIEASMGNHQVFPIMNFNYESDPATALGIVVQPTVIPGVSNTISVEPMFANTDIVHPQNSTDVVITANINIVYAEQTNAFALNTMYYDYVQANIQPYRYVTFDSSQPYLDYGSDNDYAVNNFVINGNVVNPDFGINGKSVQSTGTYLNGAVVLKESEHDDNWGTYNAGWHSSFWIQRALDDNSTGLRLLWNLNGHNDNQNIILYHYENKLHLQINNQVGNPITITSANNVNIFDYNPHHIVINHHHNNNNNILYVYVDAVLIMSQNINAYQINTINNPIHVGPNDEANNFPRLGIGTLITPFAYTALPVVPTNISAYFDEIYWDKNEISDQNVINLYNAMPGKINIVYLAQAITANATMVNPSFSTTVNYLSDASTASAQSGDHAVLAVFNNVVAALPMYANIELIPALRRDDINYSAEIMGASAIFNSAGTPRLVFAVPATATCDIISRKLPNQGIAVNAIRIFDTTSIWTKYILSQKQDSIIPTGDVK